jgi:hypothetical protein
MNFKTLLKTIDTTRFSVTRNDKTWKHTLIDTKTGQTSEFKSAKDVSTYIGIILKEDVEKDLAGALDAALATDQAAQPYSEEAMKEVPACVEIDHLAVKTLNDLRWACQIQLDLIEEGQDGTEQDDPEAIRAWLKKFGSPVKEEPKIKILEASEMVAADAAKQGIVTVDGITPAVTMEGQMTPAQQAANSVTEKEQMALKGIIDSDFQDGGDPVGHYVWSWSANPFPTQQLKSFGGVVASLEKKGLVKLTDTGEDACIAITQLGMDAYKLLTGQLNEFEVVTTN